MEFAEFAALSLHSKCIAGRLKFVRQMHGRVGEVREDSLFLIGCDSRLWSVKSGTGRSQAAEMKRRFVRKFCDRGFQDDANTGIATGIGAVPTSISP